MVSMGWLSRKPNRPIRKIIAMKSFSEGTIFLYLVLFEMITNTIKGKNRIRRSVPKDDEFSGMKSKNICDNKNLSALMKIRRKKNIETRTKATAILPRCKA
jgi:hypothetical protein